MNPRPLPCQVLYGGPTLLKSTSTKFPRKNSHCMHCIHCFNCTFSTFLCANLCANFISRLGVDTTDFALGLAQNSVADLSLFIYGNKNLNGYRIRLPKRESTCTVAQGILSPLTWHRPNGTRHEQVLFTGVPAVKAS